MAKYWGITSWRHYDEELPQDVKKYLIRLTNLAYENKEPVTGIEIGVLGAIAKAFSSK